MQHGRTASLATPINGDSVSADFPPEATQARSPRSSRTPDSNYRSHKRPGRKPNIPPWERTGTLPCVTLPHVGRPAGRFNRSNNGSVLYVEQAKDVQRQPGLTPEQASTARVNSNR